MCSCNALYENRFDLYFVVVVVILSSILFILFISTYITFTDTNIILLYTSCIHMMSANFFFNIYRHCKERAVHSSDIQVQEWQTVISTHWERIFFFIYLFLFFSFHLMKRKVTVYVSLIGAKRRNKTQFSNFIHILFESVLMKWHHSSSCIITIYISYQYDCRELITQKKKNENINNLCWSHLVLSWRCYHRWLLSAS